MMTVVFFYSAACVLTMKHGLQRGGIGGWGRGRVVVEGDSRRGRVIFLLCGNVNPHA